MSTTIIVIPCYNEAARLNVGAFQQFAHEHGDIRFCFVNDGSKDDTAAILKGMCDSNPSQMHLLHLERNAGKAEAVRNGILWALESGGDFVGFWDADLAGPLSDIPLFRSILEERPQTDLVIGARVNLLGRAVKRKLLRHYIGRAFATIACAVLWLPIYDTQCGAKLLRRTEDAAKIFERPFLSRWIFDVEMIARMAVIRKESDRAPAREAIYELPLQQWDDIQGSKLRLRDFFVVASDLVRIFFAYPELRR